MNKDFLKLLKYLAILGDVLFVLWISFNAIDEGFVGTIYQKLSFVGLVSLLILNIWLLFRKK